MMPKVLLKTSEVVPIAKVKGSSKCNELRPINTLPVIEKITETIVYETLLEHIRKYKTLTEHQSGFREQHSTESVLQLVMDDWLEAIDIRRGCSSSVLGLSESF